MSEPLSWPVIGARLERELGEPAAGARLLAQPWRSRATWAVRTRAAGELVVKVRHGDRALEKTQWCAARLPLLGARGYPVPVIVWHGMLTDEWHVGVVDWDEFGLGSRALDLIALAFDCERDGNHYAAGRLYEQAVSAVGTSGLRLVASYRMLAYLADFRREGQPSASGASVHVFSAILAKLQRTYG
jgi:hypothetical protein